MPSKPALLGNQDNYRKHDLSLLISLNSMTEKLSIYPQCLRICMEAFQWCWWGEVVKSHDQGISPIRLYIKGPSSTDWWLRPQSKVSFENE